MLSQRAQSINDFYDLSNCSGDNIKVVALLLDMFKNNPKTKIVNDLELLRTENYRNELSFLLDNLHINTIRNLTKAIELKSIANAR